MTEYYWKRGKDNRRSDGEKVKELSISPDYPVAFPSTLMIAAGTSERAHTLIKGGSGKETYLSRYSLKRFAIRTSFGSLSLDQFAPRRFSYKCRSQCGMNTIVGSGSG